MFSDSVTMYGGAEDQFSIVATYRFCVSCTKHRTLILGVEIVEMGGENNITHDFPVDDKVGFTALKEMVLRVASSALIAAVMADTIVSCDREKIEKR